MLSLEVLEGDEPGQREVFEDEGEISIGRGSEARFRLAAGYRFVSRAVHCRLEVLEGESFRRLRLSNDHDNRISVETDETPTAVASGESVEFQTPARIRFPGEGPTIWVRSQFDPETERSRTVLERTTEGDDSTVERLLADHMDWIRLRVRARLGAGLRNRVDSLDLAQEAAIRLLQYVDRAEGGLQGKATPEEFRALMRKIVENAIRDENDRWRAKKRDYRKDRAIVSDSVMVSDPPQGLSDRPSQEVSRQEQKELIEIALTMLGEEDRQMIVLRDLRKMSFPEIAEELGMNANAVRMRYNRALPKLERWVMRLLRGEIDAP